MTKELLVMECININGWYNQVRADKNKLNGLSVPTLWALRKNMKNLILSYMKRKITSTLKSLTVIQNTMMEQMKSDSA